MNISSIDWRFILLLFLIPILVKGQENFTSYWQPQVALNYRVSSFYTHNFSVAHRAYLIEEGDSGFRGRQLDMVHFSKFEIQDNQSLALGIQYRFRDIFDGGSNELRLTQQYNLTVRPLVVRYGHRFRSEQRITRNSTIHRFRYRFTSDFPLVGEKVDIGEPFFVASIEQLGSFAKTSRPEFDIRLNTQIGWQLQKGFKLLTGLEYRLENYGADNPLNILFFLTSAQLSL